MSDTADSRALTLHLHASVHLAAALTLVHAGALLCLLIVELPLIAGGALAALVCASAWRTLRRDARLSSPDAVLALTCPARGEWRLATRGGRVLHATLGPGSCAHPRLVILNFRLAPEGRRRPVVLLPDMVAPPAALRHLRRRLRNGL